MLLLIKNIAERSWNYASVIVAFSSSRHRESFPTTGLPISKDSPIESIKSRIDDILGHLVEYFLLSCFHVESLVEFENSLFLLIINVTLTLILGDKKLGSLILWVKVWKWKESYWSPRRGFCGVELWGWFELLSFLTSWIEMYLNYCYNKFCYTAELLWPDLPILFIPASSCMLHIHIILFLILDIIIFIQQVCTKS